MTPEGRVKQDIKKWLDSLGAWHCMPVTCGYGRRLVDILTHVPASPCPCCGRRGDFVAIESKRLGKDAMTFQRKILDQVRAAGGYGVSVDSVDLLQEFFYYVVRRQHQHADLPDI